jgi:hypothetical protein
MSAKRGEQMRFFVASVLVAGTGLAPASGHAQWTDAKIPGELHRTVQACAAEVRNPGDWVCVLVRCDQPGSPPGLYFSTPGPDIRDSIKLVIDSETFTVSVPASSSKSPLALSTRAEGVTSDLLEAMKAGQALSIDGTDLKPPYNRISLQDSRQAIERIERTCARWHPTPASIFRRLSRGVGLY